MHTLHATSLAAEGVALKPTVSTVFSHQQALDRAAQRLGAEGLLGAHEVLARDAAIAAELQALAVCEQGLQAQKREGAALATCVGGIVDGD